MPFLGRITPEKEFEGWEEYFDDVALAEIYGFELEDGMVQIAILDKYIMPAEKNVIHEAYCSKELSDRLFNDGYHGDNVNGLHIPDDECEYDIDAYYVSMSCAMRWLREEKGVYINIRMTLGEHEYATEPKLHFVADICDTSTGKWLDNDIWEETYEKCVETAINYYYDYKVVCELLSKYTATEKWLNRSIINIQSEYYEKHDEKMTIKTAARLALS